MTGIFTPAYSVSKRTGSDGQRNCQSLLDRSYDRRLHFRRGPPVGAADEAATALQFSPAVAAAGVAHQLIDYPSWDAGVLQPGREGMAQVMWAAQPEVGKRVLPRRPAG